MINKSDLDKRICDTEEGAENSQTWREFIKESEKEFGMANIDMDTFTEYELNKYIEFLEYLWEK